MSLKEYILECIIGAIILFIALAMYFMPYLDIPRSSGALEPSPLAAPVTHGPQRIIAILDTGADVKKLEAAGVRLCKENNYDAITGKTVIGDDISTHGTNMAYLAAYRAQSINYCILNIRVFYPGVNDNFVINRAFKHLLTIKGLSVISLSWYTSEYDFILYRLLTRLSDQNSVIFAAAGNAKEDLTIKCSFYPACYKVKNLFAVGALSDEMNGEKAYYSNYGIPVSIWYLGDFMGTRGTSTATALAAGAYARSLNDGL